LTELFLERLNENFFKSAVLNLLKFILFSYF